MDLLIIVYLLALIIFFLIGFAVFQIKSAGMKVKDFWTFIKANQTLDKLYAFSKRYEKLSPQEQIIFLAEAEEVLVHLIRYQICYGKKNTQNIWKYLINTKI